jgi:hypothetical protein
MSAVADSFGDPLVARQATVAVAVLQHLWNGLDALMDARERERVKSSAGGGSSAALQSVKDVVGLVLIADFFVVIVFLVWFLFAAAMQSTNPFFLEKFQDIFQPVVVPCLTVLMAGSIASGVVDNAGKKDGEDGNNDRR